MKLRAVYDRTLREGLYLHSFDGLTPASLRQAKTPQKQLSQGEKPIEVGDLYRDQEYRYRERDDPADLVKLQPLLTSTKLGVVPADPAARSSFQGAKIYYGFSVDPQAEDQMVRGLRQDDQDLWTDIQDIADSPYLKARGGPGVARADDTINQLQDLSRKIDKSALAYKYDQERSSALQELAKHCRTAISRMQEGNIATVGELASSGDRASENQALAQQHLRHAGISLAKKIKKPATPEEGEMSRKVAELAAGLWARLKPAGYDLIAYPQSSSDFNARFIGELQRFPGYAQAQVVELKKLLSNHAKIDIEEIWAWAQQEHEKFLETGTGRKPITSQMRQNLNPQHLSQLHAAGLELNQDPKTDHKGNLLPSNPDWVEWRTAYTAAQLEGELDKLNKSKGGPAPAEIKGMSARAAKRYLDMFSHEGLDAAGKKVLVVDDNVAYSATMQIVNHLVKKQGPAAVDLYTPFYMGT